MTSAQIRQSFLDFFKSKPRQHTIVPSSSLLPDAPNLLFTNAGMNQFVPIFLGRQPDVSKWPGALPGLDTRAADTQKCIRAGGKHNDLEDVGLDTYHHTFFEMLGNWSFGDYFKSEAIEWAWELLTEIWKFPKDRLYATVYAPDKAKGDPSDFDQEAYDCWAGKFRAAGLDPNVHVVHGGRKDNFWMMGETGPCGPCSEIHMDLTPQGDTQGKLVNQGHARCIEIWNLVFIQFNANPDGSFSPLPARHVDTGMGFERVTGIIQNTKNFIDFSRVISNYETDIFRPIFDKLENMSGKRYGSSLPGSAGVSPASVGVPPTDSARALGTRLSVEPTSSAPEAAARDAQQSDRDGRAPQASYYKRRLPHFERPWAKYMVSFSTHQRRQLSPSARDIVLKSLLFGHEQRRYQLYAACIMPDHVHFLFEPQIKEQDKEGKPVFWPLTEILHSIKSFTAHEINRFEGKTGQVWENESLDRMIRGDADLEEKFHYLCRNPWNSGVVPPTENYPWLWTPDAAPDQSRASQGKGSAGVPPASVGVPPTESARALGTSSSVESTASAPGAAARDAQQSDRDGRAPHSPLHSPEEIQLDIAFRVIADHIRTLSFAIADGIQPGNTDRNYVLRRILRRAVRYGRTLGFHEPFFYKLVDVLADTMDQVFPEVCAKKERVKEVIRTEEEAFNRTLDNGIALFEREIPDAKLRSKIVRQRTAFASEEGVMNGEILWDNEVDYLVKAKPKDTTQAFKECRFRARGKIQRFNPMLGKFIRIIAEHEKLPKAISGDAAFTLYDTHGFPIDLTELMARERGLTVDTLGVEKLMEEQRARARASQKREIIGVLSIQLEGVRLKSTATVADPPPTKFIGYDKLETPARVLEVTSLKDKTAVILDTSTCYAEMGGQVGDTGELTGSGQLWRVLGTQRSGNTWLHFIEEGSATVPVASAGVPPTESGRAAGPGSPAQPTSHTPGAVARDAQQGDPDGRAPQHRVPQSESPALPIPGSQVTLVVDRERRNSIQRHHTVTHLFHWALHEVASKEASQKGSYVGPEKLTFDFNSAPLTPQQVADIEKLVNERILENAAVSWSEVPYAAVKSRKDVMQFFGDKYGEVVRVVQIGGGAGELNGYSMELCGGTHTRATGEIGLFRIVGESAIAAGVRRIEAVAGLEAYRKATEEVRLLESLAGKVNSPVGELEKKIEALLAQQKGLEKQLKTAQQREASNIASNLKAQAAAINGIPAIIKNLGAADGDFLQSVADVLKGSFKGVIVLGGLANNAVSLVAAVSPDFTTKVHAGKIIQTIAPIVGGKGGGKPDNARGGGKDAARLEEALVKAADFLKAT